MLLSLALVTAPCAYAEPPGLALAGVYEEGVDLEGYWVSEKLDGVRAYWDGERFWSRGGNEYPAPEWFTEGFPDMPMDGELWMGRGRFAELSGAVRRLQPVDTSWRQIRFMVFDLPGVGRPFSERIQAMESVLVPSPSPFLAMVAQEVATDHDQLMAALDEVIAGGGEGLMLRRGSSLHSAGRSGDLLKVKRYQDAEAVVVAHLPGSGKYRGMLGAIQVERDDGRRFRIGTGFSDDQRRNPPPVGASITYKHYGYTSTGLPRFASFMRVRNDEPAQP
ncbi:DNA ligase [Marinobacter vulgaris]|uniref:DNA ligase n=1 Tax=Marinobacter vulgaris TaxID=1928331 RepID=A0A2V3ZQP7_9GAMM|nr:DNA ligase [Marinobacter vulgaris]PXX93834.1 DNA ligase [Marinobacter vulgaris]TSJ72786.1 DNA ligase [Marinobacter vulgaris]